MRVHGSIEYEIDGRSFGAGIVSKWAVYYSADRRGTGVSDVQVDRFEVESLNLKVGDLEHELPRPEGVLLDQWKNVFRRALSTACRRELIQRCTDDCLESYSTADESRWEARNRREMAMAE